MPNQQKPPAAAELKGFRERGVRDEGRVEARPLVFHLCHEDFGPDKAAHADPLHDHSVYQRVRDPLRPLELSSRDDLWRLLATRTISRAIDLIRRHRPGEVPGATDVELLLAREPTAAEAAEMADECRQLLNLLDEPQLRQIALCKVEGYTNEEIAVRLDCATRTIERKVSRIRLLWKEELMGLEP
jgi:hypothetical protein